jgi:hypothetical protein
LGVFFDALAAKDDQPAKNVVPDHTP